MSEFDVVLSKINIIKNCIAAIKQASGELTNDFFLLAVYEINLQRAIQACIDLANVIIAKEGLGLPNTYRQSFELLHTRGVLTAEQTKIMAAMVGFRNISVHDYDEVDPEIVKGIVQSHLKDFEEFYSVIHQRAKGWT